MPGRLFRPGAWGLETAVRIAPELGGTPRREPPPASDSRCPGSNAGVAAMSVIRPGRSDGTPSRGRTPPRAGRHRLDCRRGSPRCRVSAQRAQGRTVRPHYGPLRATGRRALRVPEVTSSPPRSQPSRGARRGQRRLARVLGPVSAQTPDAGGGGRRADPSGLACERGAGGWASSRRRREASRRLIAWYSSTTT